MCLCRWIAGAQSSPPCVVRCHVPAALRGKAKPSRFSGVEGRRSILYISSIWYDLVNVSSIYFCQLFLFASSFSRHQSSSSIAKSAYTFTHLPLPRPGHCATKPPPPRQADLQEAIHCQHRTVMLIDGEKYACEACVRGHRVSTCQHSGKPPTSPFGPGESLTLAKTGPSHTSTRKEDQSHNVLTVEVFAKLARPTSNASAEQSRIPRKNVPIMKARVKRAIFTRTLGLTRAYQSRRHHVVVLTGCAVHVLWRRSTWNLSQKSIHQLYHQGGRQALQSLAYWKLVLMTILWLSLPTAITSQFTSTMTRPTNAVFHTKYQYHIVCLDRNTPGGLQTAYPW